MTKLEKELNSLFDAFKYLEVLPGAKTYPPYNIIQIDQYETVIEIAVAGFKKDELFVTVEKDKLKVVGRKSNEDIANYLYKGIGARTFERIFTLANDVKINGAEYADGILSIFIKVKPPEEKKKSDIPIILGNRNYLTQRTDIF